MKTDRYYKQQKDSPGCVDVIDVQTVHKFAGCSPNLDFKVTIFFNVKYFENGTTYNGTLKSYTIYRMVPFSMTLNDPNQTTRACHYSTLIISATVKDKHTVTRYD